MLNTFDELVGWFLQQPFNEVENEIPFLGVIDGNREQHQTKSFDGCLSNL
jgi:hypothetical protein